MPVPSPTLVQSGVESVFPSNPNSKSNAQIVIARDRPASIWSGYGGQGHQRSSTIDIVAGRMSYQSKSSMIDNKGNTQPAFADPNFELDAARIYISEKTDIDDNFGLRYPDLETAVRQFQQSTKPSFPVTISHLWSFSHTRLL